MEGLNELEIFWLNIMLVCGFGVEGGRTDIACGRRVRAGCYRHSQPPGVQLFVNDLTLVLIILDLLEIEEKFADRSVCIDVKALLDNAFYT